MMLSRDLLCFCWFRSTAVLLRESTSVRVLAVMLPAPTTLQLILYGSTEEELHSTPVRVPYFPPTHARQPERGTGRGGVGCTGSTAVAPRALCSSWTQLYYRSKRSTTAVVLHSHTQENVKSGQGGERYTSVVVLLQ